MRRTARVWVLLLGSVLSGAFSGCAREPEYACTLIGCTSGARLDVLTIADAARLEGASIRVCRNEVCSDALLPAVPAMVGAGASRDVKVPLPVRILMERHAGGVDVSVDTFPEGEPSIHLRDGDVYTAVMSDRDGAIIAEPAWTATYDESYPNGPACDPSPCLQARLAPLVTTHDVSTETSPR